MSKPKAALPVVRWTASAEITFYDPAVGATRDFRSLKQAAQALDSRAVVACLSRRTAFIRSLRVPNISPQEVERMLSVQIGQLFPIKAEELAFGFRLTNDVTPEGRLAIVDAVPLATLRKVFADFAEAGLRVEHVVPAAFGSALMAQKLGAMTCAVVEVAPEGLAIDIIDNGELVYSRIAPATEDAETIETEIARTFGISGVQPADVIVAGNLDLPSAQFRPGESTLVLLAGADIDRLGVKLELPEESRKRKQQKEVAKTRLAVLGLAAALLLCAWVGLDYSDMRAAAKKSDSAWNSKTARLKRQRDTLQNGLNEMQRMATPISRSFEPAQTASDVLTVVGQGTPDDLWLTGFSFERGKPVTIRGTSKANESISAFLEYLSAQDRFRDVKLVFANNGVIADTPVVNFSITFLAVGNIPISEAQKKGVKA